MKSKGRQVLSEVFTVGHSTKTLEEFIQTLKQYDIKKVVDVRTMPRSRYNPQFNKETFKRSLNAEGIRYLHMPGLGGLRHPVKNSPNAAWRNASFRGFADYMQTEEFKKNLDVVIKLIKKERIVLMCAEILPWRCHRSLISDALFTRGILAKHIFSPTNCKDHEITPWAKIKGRLLIYPGPS